MAQFRRGADVIRKAAERKGGGRFAPVMTFEAGETRYIQFLLPMDEIPTVLMHRFIIVGHNEAGNPIYERFISRRDPALEGPDGYDEIYERFGLSPKERTLALVAEMEPVKSSGSGRRQITGFDLAERQFENKEGEVVSVPAFQLIDESQKTFFVHLASNNDIKPIEETIWAVKRNGKTTDTTYTFIDTGVDALDLEDEYEEFTKTFDFEAWMDELADEDRMRDLIGDLPDDWRISQFADKEKGKSKSSGRSRRNDDEDERPRSRRSRARQEEPEDDPEAKEPEEDEKPARSSRSRRFKALQESTRGRD